MITEQTLFDGHDIAVGQAVDEVLASLEAGDIENALEVIERAVGVSELHPAYALRASSEFHRLESLVRICVSVLATSGESTRNARAVLGRISALKLAGIH